MPQFSRAKFKMRQDIQATDDMGVPNEFRATAYLQFRTEWDDNARRFKPMSPEQQALCDELHQQLFEAGVEFGISVQYRAEGVEDVKDMPKVMTFSLLCNEPKEKRQPVASAPSASDDNGW
jgi:hypothetical protein